MAFRKVNYIFALLFLVGMLGMAFADTIITINNPNTQPAHSKTITASVDDQHYRLFLSINNPGILICDRTLTFINYSEQTFNSESDNGKTICYKAKPGEGEENTIYQLSNPIQGIDWTAPIITLNGANPQAIIVGDFYIELGAEVTDNYSTELVAEINSSEVLTSVIGDYPVIYNAIDTAGNIAIPVTRVIKVRSDMTAYAAALAAVIADDYTTITWAAYMSIVNANVVTDQNTQAEVDTATANIVAAQENLIKIVITPTGGGGGGGTRVTVIPTPEPIVTVVTAEMPPDTIISPPIVTTMPPAVIIEPTPTDTTTPALTETAPAATAGATGFLGLPGGAASTTALIVVALLILGTAGYFLFFKKK